MERSQPNEGFLASFSHYFAWLITAIGAVIDALAIREAILAILALYRVIRLDAFHRAGGVGQDLLTGFGISAVDNLMLLILGCAAVAMTIWIEYYFRKGRPKGQLYRRIGKVVVVEVAIIVIALLIRLLISRFI